MHGDITDNFADGTINLLTKGVLVLCMNAGQLVESPTKRQKGTNGGAKN